MYAFGYTFQDDQEEGTGSDRSGRMVHVKCRSMKHVSFYRVEYDEEGRVNVS